MRVTALDRVVKIACGGVLSVAITEGKPSKNVVLLSYFSNICRWAFVSVGWQQRNFKEKDLRQPQPLSDATCYPSASPVYRKGCRMLFPPYHGRC